MSIEQKTIAATTTLGCSSEAELDFLSEYTKNITGVTSLRKRQIAGNYFELEVYCEDITDVYLLGLALGRQFPKQESEQNNLN